LDSTLKQATAASSHNLHHSQPFSHQCYTTYAVEEAPLNNTKYRILNLGNTCYLSLQNLMSSHVLSKNIKIKIYNTKIVPVILYMCETWSLAQRERHNWVFENRVLRIYVPMRA
jgi:hypothetical protein